MDHTANYIAELATNLKDELATNGPTDKADEIWRGIQTAYKLRRRPVFVGIDLSRGDDTTVQMCNCPKRPGLHPVHEDNPYSTKETST